MHRLLTLVAGFLLLAGTAQAGTLTSATWVGTFHGTPFTLTTGGGSLIASGSSTGASISMSVTLTPQSFSTLIHVPQMTLTETLGGSQTIAATVGSATANVGIGGSANAFLFIGFPVLFLNIPLSIGVSGTSFIETAHSLLGAVVASATFFKWTPGAVTVTGLFATTTTVGGSTNMSVALPTFTTAGSFMLTGGGAGTVTLVAPSVTSMCVGGPVGACSGVHHNDRTVRAAALTLNFVPAPDTLLLLGAGLAALVAVGRRQRS